MRTNYDWGRVKVKSLQDEDNDIELTVAGVGSEESVYLSANLARKLARRLMKHADMVEQFIGDSYDDRVGCS